MLRNSCCCHWLVITSACLFTSPVLGNTIAPYSGCGTLTFGVECPQFIGDDGTSFSITNTGKFTIGDHVFVSGTICFDCVSICQQGPVFETSQITECGKPPPVPVFNECGMLVFEQGSVPCLLFQADQGGLYAIENTGKFTPGQHLRVTGSEWPVPCLSLCGEIAGCLFSNDIQSCIVGDVNADGAVDVDDLLEVITAWGPGPCTLSCPPDVNNNGVVDVDDLLLVIANWSPAQR